MVDQQGEAEEAAEDGLLVQLYLFLWWGKGKKIYSFEKGFGYYILEPRRIWGARSPCVALLIIHCLLSASECGKNYCLLLGYSFVLRKKEPSHFFFCLFMIPYSSYFQWRDICFKFSGFFSNFCFFLIWFDWEILDLRRRWATIMVATIFLVPVVMRMLITVHIEAVGCQLIGEIEVEYFHACSIHL